jgi:hypothetical protein
MATGKKTGGGSRKGVPNKATADVRAAIALLTQNNVGRMQQWLDAIAKRDPARAYELLLRTMEFHIPKIGRTEVSGPDGGALQVIRRVFQWPLPKTALDAPHSETRPSQQTVAPAPDESRAEFNDPSTDSASGVESF